MVDAIHRQKLVNALPTFMNQCEGGACRSTGVDLKSPDEFELAALTAMDAIHTIATARYHHSHKIAIFRALEAEIRTWTRTL